MDPYPLLGAIVTTQDLAYVANSNATGLLSEYAILTQNFRREVNRANDLQIDLDNARVACDALKIDLDITRATCGAIQRRLNRFSAEGKQQEFLLKNALMAARELRQQLDASKATIEQQKTQLATVKRNNKDLGKLLLRKEAESSQRSQPHHQPVIVAESPALLDAPSKTGGGKPITQNTTFISQQTQTEPTETERVNEKTSKDPSKEIKTESEVAIREIAKKGRRQRKKDAPMRTAGTTSSTDSDATANSSHESTDTGNSTQAVTKAIASTKSSSALQTSKTEVNLDAAATSNREPNRSEDSTESDTKTYFSAKESLAPNEVPGKKKRPRRRNKNKKTKPWESSQEAWNQLENFG